MKLRNGLMVKDMTKFISLHDRIGSTDVVVNVEQIVFIRDLRTDHSTHSLEGFHFTVVETTGASIEVKETKDEILKLIFA